MTVATRTRTRPREELSEVARADAAPPPATEVRQVYQIGEPISCSCPRVVTWRPAADDHRLVAAFVTVWHREECTC